MAREMEAPPGAWQRAVLVAVPLALVVLIFLTPGLIAPENTQATDIPFLLVEVTGEPWNASVNETALLYVRSALGVPLYNAIEIVVRDPNGTSSASGTFVPSVFLKVPVVDAWTANVTTMAVKEASTFRFNATVSFAWDEAGWILLVQAEDATAPREYRETFRASMRREAEP
jgi:hypothetical protein